MSLSLSLSLFLSLSLSLFLSVSLSLCLSFSLSLFRCVTPHSLSLYLALSPSLSLTHSLCLSHSLSVCLSHSLSVCLSQANEVCRANRANFMEAFNLADHYQTGTIPLNIHPIAPTPNPRTLKPNLTPRQNRYPSTFTLSTALHPNTSPYTQARSRNARYSECSGKP